MPPITFPRKNEGQRVKKLLGPNKVSISQSGALQRATAPAAAPVPVAPTPTVAPTPVAPAPVATPAPTQQQQLNAIRTGISAAQRGVDALPSQNAAADVPVAPTQLQQIRERLVTSRGPTEREIGLQESINKRLTAGEKGIEDIRGQAIPQGLLVGQAAALERQAIGRLAPLQRQLALLQQQRTGEREAATEELGFAQADQTTLQGLASQALGAGATDEQIQGILSAGSTQAGFEAAAATGLLRDTEEDAGFTLSPGQQRFDAEGNVIASGGPRQATDAQINAALARTEKDEASLQTQVSTVGIVNGLLNNIEELDAVSGLIRTTFAGTADTRGALAQLKGLTSLAERDKLKGSGTISDFEAGMLANSANSLNFAIQDDGTVKMSETDLQQNLKNIRGVALLKSGESVSVVITDPATGESRTFDDQTRDSLQEASLQGFIIDFE